MQYSRPIPQNPIRVNLQPKFKLAVCSVAGIKFTHETTELQNYEMSKVLDTTRFLQNSVSG